MSLWRRDRERARSLHEGKVGAERRNCARALGNEEVRQTPFFCVCESPPAGSPLGALRLIALHGKGLARLHQSPPDILVSPHVCMRWA